MAQYSGLQVIQGGGDALSKMERKVRLDSNRIVVSFAHQSLVTTSRIRGSGSSATDLVAYKLYLTYKKLRERNYRALLEARHGL